VGLDQSPRLSEYWRFLRAEGGNVSRAVGGCGLVVFAAALLFLHAAGALAAGPKPSVQQLALRNLADDSTRRLVVRTQPGERIPAWVTGRIPVAEFSTADATKEQARDFWAEYGAAFGLADPDEDLVLRSATTDRLGMRHLRYDQRYYGLPVFGRQLVLHFKGSAVTAVNGDVAPSIDVSTSPGISASAAAWTARLGLAKLRPSSTPRPPTLLIYVDDGGRPHLAWRVTVPTRRPLGLRRVFVDAHTGETLLSYDDLHAVKNRAIYTNGNNPDCNFAEAPLCTLPGTLVRDEDDVPIGDNVVDAAHDNLELVYNYFQNAHGRDSYDGTGHEIRSTVHMGVDFNNAFWCPDDCAAAYGSEPDGEQLVFGDGDGVEFAPLAQGLDVVAHEFTHAVTENTANLLYLGQAGALNESYSDVFAVMVDNADWLLGEDVTTGDAVRSLEDPTAFGQPAHMANYVNTAQDSAGIHVNSGIPSKAAHLVAADPTYGLGISDTEQIYYRALTTYLTPTSDFMAHLNALIRSATDLFGPGSPQVQAVTRAHAAVGLANRPTVTSPNGGELFAAATPTSVQWNQGDDTGLPFRVEHVQDSAATYTQNFEASATLPGEFASAGQQPWSTTTLQPGNGVGSARSGAIGDNERSELSLIVRLTAPSTITFKARVSSEEGFDFFSFHVDGVMQFAGSGEIPWTLAPPPVTVPAGTHMLSWVYDKDELDSSGSDAAWIDDIGIPNAESVSATTINASAGPGAGSQAWTTPSISGTFRARVHLVGVAPWLASDDSNSTFLVDGALPTDPTLTSPSHTSGRLSSNRVVEVAWSGATDNLSGVDGFSFAWDTSSTAVPDTTKEAEETAGRATSPPLADGAHYFHLRTRDNVGNWTATAHAGPFMIDGTPPQTTISSRAVAARRATFRFTSSERGSTFSCSLDGAAFAPCTSPRTYRRLSPRSHSFRTRATDQAGNADPSPATAKFRIRPGCVVPSVRGRTLVAARRALSRARCTTGRVSAAFSMRVGRGRVIAQAPRRGARLPSRAKVRLVISRGRRL
jgi:bacillolysin